LLKEKIFSNSIMEIDRNLQSYFMDLEYSLIESGQWNKPICDILGKKRLDNKEWCRLVKITMENETNFELYLKWVLDGGGDDWIVDEY
jgi:hypothetical protein